MLMTMMTTKMDEFIVQGLDPFNILKGYANRFWNGDRDIYIYVNVSIGSVVSLFSLFRGLVIGP
jgi:hypothetical protein